MSSETTMMPMIEPKEIWSRPGSWSNESTWRWMRWALIALELSIIAAWCVALSLDFHDTNKYQVIGGNDFFISVQGRFFWDHVRSCGMCALWNGDARGGAPAFIDANVDMMHPIVAIPAYLFGTLQGAKVTIPLAFFLGSLAVWWLALELGAGVIARVVTACMMGASGAMAGRLQEGLVVLVTAAATASLVLPALLRIAHRPTRRSAALLGLALGLAVIGGQGYIQLGLIIMSPLVVILLIWSPIGWKKVLPSLITAGVIGLLIGMVFLLPYARFYPNSGKVFDVAFGAYQPMRYLTLNLAISDYDFMESEALHKLGYAAWYSYYVGWIAIAFAVVGFGLLWRRSKRTTFFLAAIFLSSLWIGSGAPFRLLADAPFVDQDTRVFAWSIRIPSFITALAIPPLLGFAAVAIDTGVKLVISLPESTFPRWLRQARPSLLVSWTARAAIIALLFFGLRDLYHFARGWMWAVTLMTEETANSYVDALRTDDLAWVAGNNNDAVLSVLGMDGGLKTADTWRSWHIDGVDLPLPFKYFLIQGDPPAEMTETGAWNGNPIYEGVNGNAYATSTSGGVCHASGEGGKIEVACSQDAPGRIVVQELDLGNWDATVNGVETPVVTDGQWIAVDAPAGDVQVEFRYRPWDFWVGLGLSGIGFVTAAMLLLIPRNWRFHVRWSRTKSLFVVQQTVE